MENLNEDFVLTKEDVERHYEIESRIYTIGSCLFNRIKEYHPEALPFNKDTVMEDVYAVGSDCIAVDTIGKDRKTPPMCITFPFCDIIEDPSLDTSVRRFLEQHDWD